MDAPRDTLPLIDDELDLMARLVPLDGQRIIELGCGAAKLARALLRRHPSSRITGLEVDERQHAKNLADPFDGLEFVAGGAQAIPFPDAAFDQALMLKSLHHVPTPLLSLALSEAARVLRPGGHLYVSEPVYGGDLNEIVRHYNEEGAVRAAAQAALDDALRGDAWEQVAQQRFGMPVAFKSFADFEARMMRATFHETPVSDAMLAATRDAYGRFAGPDGATAFERPMHVRVLRRRG